MRALQSPPAKIALRLVLAWAGLSLLCAWLGRDAVSLLLPLLTGVSDSISNEFSTLLEWGRENPRMLIIVATFDHPLATIQALHINSGATVRAGTNVEHIFVPVVILFTVLIGWPAANLKHRLLLVVSGVPLTVVSVLLTSPFLLVGKVETLLQTRADAFGVLRAEPFYLHWMLFTEAGGRWLIPIVLGTACAMLLRRILAMGSSAPGGGVNYWKAS